MASSDEDYNELTSERSEILQRLQDALGDVPPHFWAACRVCDLSELENMVTIAKINPCVIYVIAAQTHGMMANWNQSFRGLRSESGSPQLSPIPQAATQAASSDHTSSPLEEQMQDTNTPPAKRRKIAGLLRSKLARENAAQRDNYRCVISGADQFQVAHIYPFSLLKKKDNEFGNRHVFWNMLRCLWSEQKVIAWRKELFPDDLYEAGAEITANMICLNSYAHALWNKGAFALKPISISDDKTTLTIQFFWQATGENVQSKMNLLTTTPSTRDLNHFGHSRLSDYRKSEASYIKSGDLFILKTDNPEIRPLPSMALLEMQWNLQRIMGMAGAAYTEEDEEGEDSDKAISDMGLDEIGESSFISNDMYSSDPAVPDLKNAYPLPTVEEHKHETEEVSEEEAIAEHGM